MEDNTIICPCCNHELVIVITDGKVLNDGHYKLNSSDEKRILEELNIEFG